MECSGLYLICYGRKFMLIWKSMILDKIFYEALGMDIDLSSSIIECDIDRALQDLNCI